VSQRSCCLQHLLRFPKGHPGSLYLSRRVCLSRGAPAPFHITGAKSLNEQDLHDNLSYLKVPEAGIDSIRSKLALKIFDEYANILKVMYSTRFKGVREKMTPMTR
jgi:hypothetical protein